MDDALEAISFDTLWKQYSTGMCLGGPLHSLLPNNDVLELVSHSQVVFSTSVSHTLVQQPFILRINGIKPPKLD